MKRRTPLLVGILGALLLVGCQQEAADPSATNGTANTPATGEPASAGEGYLNPAAARDGFAQLVAAAGSDQLLQLGIRNDEMLIAVAVDPTTDGSSVETYVLDSSGTVSGPNTSPTPYSMATTPMSPSDVDIDQVLDKDFGCPTSEVSLYPGGFAVRQIVAHCVGAEEGDASIYWLDRSDPVQFDVTDPQFVQDALELMAQGSSGELSSLMIVHNGQSLDDPPVTYSNIQPSFIDGDQIRYLRMDDYGFVFGSAMAERSEYSSAPFALSELDVPGLLACSAQLLENSGLPGGTVQVKASDQGLVYSWRGSDESTVTTNTDCQVVG